jgi:hypothetical protein
MAVEVAVLGHTLHDELDDVDVVVDRIQLLVVVLVVVDLELVEKELVLLTLVARVEIPQLVIDKKLFDPLDITDDHFSYPFKRKKRKRKIFYMNYYLTYI